MLLMLGFASDYTRWRFPFVALGFLFTFIGFVIYANVNVETELQVAYFACFIMTWGTSAPSVLLGKRELSHHPDATADLGPQMSGITTT